MSRTVLKVRKKFGTAVVTHKLIENNDRILVAVSGGKDSLVMLKLLCDIKKKFPISYKLLACHLRNDLSPLDIREKTADYLQKIFAEWDVEYIMEDLSVAATSAEDKRLGCFWCSWQRRKRLFELCEKYGMNKLALGHHRDDINETLLMNLFYHGKLATMPIKLSMFNDTLTLIRPLAYVGEKEIRTTAQNWELTVTKCSCPYAQFSKREYLKELIERLEKEYNKNIRGTLFNAARFDRIDPTYLH